MCSEFLFLLLLTDWIKLNKRLAEMDTEIASEEERLSSLTTSADEIKAKIAFHDDLIARTDPAYVCQS